MPRLLNWFTESAARRRHVEAYLAVIAVLIALAFVIGIYRQETDVAKRVACAQRLKRIMVALEMYSQDHDSAYPPEENWARSVLPYIDTLEVFCCPADPDFRVSTTDHKKKLTFQDHTSYWYIKPESNDEPSALAVAGDRMYFNMIGNHKDGGNIAFFDSHVKWYSTDQWEKHGFHTDEISHEK